MAKKGLSIPVIADYVNKGNGVVAYENPIIADSAVEYSVEIDSADNKDLYADNRVKESAPKVFSGGNMTLTTADITTDLGIRILGLKTVKTNIGGQQIEEIVYDDDAEPPFLGFGIIEEHQIDGVTLYKPVFLTKVKFANPGLSATTREKEIDWKTQEIKASIYRSDQVDNDFNHPWQRSPKTWMSTEEEARQYIMDVLGGTVETAE